MASLDALDTAILRELQSDARRTNRDLAASVGVARPPHSTVCGPCATAVSSPDRPSPSTSPRSDAECRR